VSKKGHAPYNPRKKNQDSLIMADDPTTNSLILAVLDGHGEHGDYVSAWFRDQLISEMFNHPSWTTNLQVACADAIAKVERDLLRNFRIDTEFSGTTLSMAIIRGNQLTGVNIGDSRVILGKEENGRIVPVEITLDHKPDSPQEKERILACGGRVFAVEYDDGIDGPPRVWLGHMDVPGLAMSRYGVLCSWISIVCFGSHHGCLFDHLHCQDSLRIWRLIFRLTLFAIHCFKSDLLVTSSPILLELHRSRNLVNSNWILSKTNSSSLPRMGYGNSLPIKKQSRLWKGRSDQHRPSIA
jgi:hypothetical protein